MSTRTGLSFAALSLLTGCLIAPAEVDATLTVGPQQVKYRATLKDMR